jgi:FkbM family methyltransferase
MGLASKLSTAKRVYKQNGISGVLAKINQLVNVRAHLHGWWWAEHPLIGRIVEWRGNIVHVDGLQFNVDHPAITRGVKALFILNRYETPEREALRTFIDPTLPVIELGASIGVISCLTNKKLLHPLKHVVVEANPDLIPLLESNRERNRCCFTVLHAAVSYSAEEVEFLISDSILASSATRMDGRFRISRIVRIPTISLQNIIDKFGFPECTLICDIECGEVELVHQEIDTIKKHVSTILMEIHNTTLDQQTVDSVVRTLNVAGFTLAHRIRKTYIFTREKGC